MDTYIRSDVTHKNYGANDSLRIQKVGTSGANRILIAFSQTAIADSLAGDSLISATLEFTIKRNGNNWGAAGRNLATHRMLRQWTEGGATWACAHDTNVGNNIANCPGNTWSMTSGTLPYVASPLAQSKITNSQSGVVTFDVTNDVRAFLAAQATNLGWLLKLSAEAQTGTVVFHSRESASKPRLVLTINQSTVPPQAPDSEPAGLYQASKLVPLSAGSPDKVVRDAVSVLFKDTATPTQRSAVVARIRGTVIGGTHITSNDGFYIIRVPDPGSIDSLERIVSSLDTAQAVDLALPEYLSGAVGLYRLPVDGDSFTKADFGVLQEDARGTPWYLTAVNAPLAWGCSIGNDAVPVAVVDEEIFFISSIPDLTPTISFRTDKYPGGQHGIRVASVLAARGNNQQGMTGMMWASNLRLYDVVQLDPQTGHVNIDSTTSLPAYSARAVANRISLAIRDGARIINLSLGVLSPPPAVPTKRDSLFRQKWAAAVQRTLNKFPAASRPLIVIGAGNLGVDAWWSGYPRLESHFPNEVLVVAGSNRASTALYDNAGGKSNFGPLVTIAAPGEEMAALDGAGDLRSFGETSAAAPLVAGLAGLLLGFDQALTTQELHDLILQGALAGGRSADSIPIIDAYQSLKLAAERPGAPLCGNRVWVDSAGTIKVRRTSASASTLFPVGDTVWGVTPMHGRKRLQFTTISGIRTIRYEDGLGSWELSTAQNDPDSFPSGTARSVLGLSHDGDSLVTLSDGIFNPGESRAAEVRLGAPGSPNSRVVTVFNVANPPKINGPSYCYAMGVGGCAGAIGSYDNVFYQFLTSYYSPRYDKVVVAINYVSQKVYPLPWESCSGGQCRTINFDYQSDSTVIWSVDVVSGQKQRLGATESRSTFWMGIAETDDALALGSAYRIYRIRQGHNVGSEMLTNECVIEYRSRDYTSILEQIPSSNGCHMQNYSTNDRVGGGTLASSVHAPPVDGRVMPYLPSDAEVARAWGH